SSVRCVWFRISQSLRRALHVWLTLRRPKQRNANPLLGPVAFVLASAAVGATSGTWAPTTRSAAARTSGKLAKRTGTRLASAANAYINCGNRFPAPAVVRTDGGRQDSGVHGTCNRGVTRYGKERIRWRRATRD